MTVHEFALPDLGEGLTEAEIVSWLVAVGDTIAIDQPVVEVESAKSVVELPSPFGGTVTALFGRTGELVRAGQVLLTVTDASVTGAGVHDTGVPDTGVPDTGAPDTASGPGPGAGPGAGGSGAVLGAGGSGAVLVGYGTSENTRPVRRPVAGRFGVGAGRPRDPGSLASLPAPPGARSDPARAGIGRSPVASPIVRRLARERGVDATTLSGTGPDGLVLRGDVESYLAGQGAAAVLGGPIPALSSPGHPPANIRIPILGLRKVVADRLATSRREIPEATIWRDVDATGLSTARDRLLEVTGERFGVTALIARFVVAGLRRYPILNSSVDTASQEILQYGAINLGIAAQTANGLMVPVVHGAHAMTTRQLRDAVSGLVTTARTGAFAPGELRGGTFTLNNFGTLGVDGSAAIINHPEAAILGIGRMIERPWVVDHALAVRTVVELSLVFDHRVCDGGTAAGFLAYIARCIESPLTLLPDL